MPAGWTAAFVGEDQRQGCRGLYIMWWQVRCPDACHTGSWTLWLEQSGSLYLSIKQVCSCFPECWLRASMHWSSLVGGLPMWQDLIGAQAHRSACDGRQSADWEALLVPINLAPNDVVVHCLWLT